MSEPVIVLDATAEPFAVVKRKSATPAGIISALFGLAACAVAMAPPMGPLPGWRRRERRAAEKPYGGPKVEHVETKGPRKLTRRQRKAKS